jgi:hypothetical protein
LRPYHAEHRPSPVVEQQRVPNPTLERAVGPASDPQGRGVSPAGAASGTTVTERNNGNIAQFRPRQAGLIRPYGEALERRPRKRTRDQYNRERRDNDKLPRRTIVPRDYLGAGRARQLSGARHGCNSLARALVPGEREHASHCLTELDHLPAALAVTNVTVRRRQGEDGRGRRRARLPPAVRSRPLAGWRRNGNRIMAVARNRGGDSAFRRSTCAQCCRLRRSRRSSKSDARSSDDLGRGGANTSSETSGQHCGHNRFRLVFLDKVSRVANSGKWLGRNQ